MLTYLGDTAHRGTVRGDLLGAFTEPSSSRSRRRRASPPQGSFSELSRSLPAAFRVGVASEPGPARELERQAALEARAAEDAATATN